MESRGLIRYWCSLSHPAMEAGLTDHVWTIEELKGSVAR
jgi:hypothetical protein